MKGWLVGIGMMMALVGCRKTQPQRPYVLGEQRTDTAVVQLLEVNQQMVDKADMQLAMMAKEGYVLMEENYWVKGLTPVEGDSLRENDYIQYEAMIYDMKDRLVSTHEANVEIGKVDEIKAIVDVLGKMQRGQQISMLVPWYLAYGSAGNQDVMPYENLRIELSVR